MGRVSSLDARRIAYDTGLTVHFVTFGRRSVQNLLGDMMVSKIAVIALVAIVACPILLGYALNLEETTVTDYRPMDDSVNVTPLLQNGTEWSYADADPAQLNNPTTSFGDNSNIGRVVPYYNTISTVKTTTPLLTSVIGSWGGGVAYNMQDYLNYDVLIYYDVSPTNYVTAEFYDSSNTLLLTINYLTHFNYDAASNNIVYSAYSSSAVGSPIIMNLFALNANLLDHISYTVVGGNKQLDYSYILKSSNPYYADISGGWYFGKYPNQPPHYKINLPQNTNSLLYTINLDSITAPNYSVCMYMYPIYYLFSKTTTGGVATYTLQSLTAAVPDGRIDFELYYDPARSDNTYQFYYQVEKVSEDSTSKYYNEHIECRYVGGWPAVIGEANAYLTYSGDVSYTSTIYAPDIALNLQFFATNSIGDPNATRTPTMRVDSATFRAFEKPVIENQEYDPAVYRTAPATTLGGDYINGYSFTFGGNTYLLDSENKITIGTHKIPVKGMVLDSIPAEGGGYDNRINGTVISNTASPSTIIFNGKWNASISTQSMESYTYTHTDWKVGEFAWDGIDQNFLMVGLITCLGVFIALGIYARKKGSGGLIPLMIVTGCAAAVFFIML